MQQNILSLIIITFGALGVAQLAIQVQNQCECSQFDQSTCGTLNNYQSCGWNTTTQACERLECFQLQNQSTCLKNFYECWWNGTYCQEFISCSNLISSQKLTCSQQNIQCGLNLFNSTCTSLDNLPECFIFNQTQCTPQQIGYQGSLCFWDETCQTATSCLQLTQDLCQYQINSCIWDDFSNQCVQLQCSDYTFEQECTYVIEPQNPQTIIPCQFVYGECQSIQSASSLNAQDCSSKTLQTYFWLQVSDTNGLCIPCLYKTSQHYVINQYQPNNECQCSSYLSEQCQQTDYCYWSNDQCYTLECNQIKDQLSCIGNRACIWQYNFCSYFMYCPYAQNQQQCLSSSLYCPFFSSRYQQCYSLTANTCSYFYTSQNCLSQLGYCYWDQYQCLQVQKCGQISSQRNCIRFAYSCIWSQGKCQQLTCASIQNSKNCMYTIPNLYSNDIQPCTWKSGSCQNLIDFNSLNATQCISNTLHTYKWTGSRCLSCSQYQNLLQISLQLPSQCSCSQLSYQNDCIQTSSCIWTGNNCQILQCSNITIQMKCASNPNCVWFKGECQNFKFCADLTGASQSDCIIQSINCPASNGQICHEKNYLQSCSSYQTQSSCTDVLGKNGFCLWQSGTCQVLSKCQQLLQYKDCLHFAKHCYWGNKICQPVSCSTFNNPQTCQYYYSSITSFNPISCYWNSNQSVCSQTTDFMNQLNSATCSTNTKQTARWSKTLNVCLSCRAIPLLNPYKCACYLLISQINCMQSQECIWNTQSNQCEQQSCINLNQSLCIQNSQCMWIGFCSTFTSCNFLKAVNSEECAAQTLRCPFYNSTQSKCQAISNIIINCEAINNQNDCQRFHSQYFSCQWNYQTNKCLIELSCIYYSQYDCNAQPFCYWNNRCYIKDCKNYTTLESCTFVINIHNWNYIQSCQWLNGACVPEDNVFSEQTCFINTDQTARWSSNKQDGYCIPCNFKLNQLIVPNNKCQCSQLLTQYECDSNNCYWDRQFCYENNCNYNKVQCAQIPKCYWAYHLEYRPDGYCEAIPKIKIQEFCKTLRGKNSLECLSQTTLCPVSIEGVCQSRDLLQTCSSMKSLQLCSNGIGQEGYCKYENQSCQVLSSCKQLKNLNECYLFDKACQWDTSTGLCIQMTCESYSQTNCSYVFQNLNQVNIQYCFWNGRNCSSAQYAISSYTLQTCYQNTGGTYHWSNSQSTYGTCVSCSLNKIQPKYTCPCTLLNELECNLSKPVCKLNQNNQCVKSECQEIFDQLSCSQQNECMWQSNKCVTFTSCTDLYGYSSLDCIAQSLQCQTNTNHICKSVSSLDTCSQYSIEFCKIDIIGSDGLYQWNSINKICQVISTCDQVISQIVCQSLIPACQWSNYFSSCVPFQCQDYINEEQCINIIINLQDPQILLCEWKNYKCVPYVDTIYRFDDSICYINSDQTYRSIKNDKNGIICQQCLSAFFINIIVLAILIIL